MKRKQLLSTLLLGFLLAVPPLAAQDFIRDPQYVKDHYSFVRELRTGEWIIGNTYYNVTFFTRIDASGSVYRELYQHVSQLHDMEVYNGIYVFYCGVWGGDPVFGYFDGTSDCPQEVYYPKLKEYCGLTDLKKMDLYEHGGKLHVVMTATKVGNTDCIVDAVIDMPGTTTSPVCDIFVGQDANYPDATFDDIAVTDRFVVVTARKNTTGNVYSFYQGVPFLNSPVARYQYYYDVNDTMLLTRYKGDAIATATKVTSPPTVRTTVLEALSGNHTGTCDIPYNASDLRLRDISFSLTHSCIKVLTNDMASNTSTAVPVGIPGDLSGGTAYAHLYADNILSSIRGSDILPQCFACSGHRTDWAQVLRLYVFQPGFWGNCTEKESVKLSPISNIIESHSPNCVFNHYEVPLRDSIECYVDRPASTVCR